MAAAGQPGDLRNVKANQDRGYWTKALTHDYYMKAGCKIEAATVIVTNSFLRDSETESGYRPVLYYVRRSTVVYLVVIGFDDSSWEACRLYHGTLTLTRALEPNRCLFVAFQHGKSSRQLR